MKPTELLINQHRKIEAILRKLESGRSDPEPLLEALANNLTAHMAIEQKFLYPALRVVDEGLMMRSYEEHAVTELSLKRLLGTDPDVPTFPTRVTILKELFLQHVKEEEQQLLAEIEQALEQESLEELGGRMETAFEEALEAGYEAALPRGAKTTADAAEVRVFSASTDGAR